MPDLPVPFCSETGHLTRQNYVRYRMRHRMQYRVRYRKVILRYRTSLYDIVRHYTILYVIIRYRTSTYDIVRQHAG